jgi:hypothetical protein
MYIECSEYRRDPNGVPSSLATLGMLIHVYSVPSSLATLGANRVGGVQLLRWHVQI